MRRMDSKKVTGHKKIIAAVIVIVVNQTNYGMIDGKTKAPCRENGKQYNDDRKSCMMDSFPTPLPPHNGT